MSLCDLPLDLQVMDRTLSGDTYPSPGTNRRAFLIASTPTVYDLHFSSFSFLLRCSLISPSFLALVTTHLVCVIIRTAATAKAITYHMLVPSTQGTRSSYMCVPRADMLSDHDITPTAWCRKYWRFRIAYSHRFTPQFDPLLRYLDCVWFLGAWSFPIGLITKRWGT